MGNLSQDMIVSVSHYEEEGIQVREASLTFPGLRAQPWEGVTVLLPMELDASLLTRSSTASPLDLSWHEIRRLLTSLVV